MNFVRRRIEQAPALSRKARQSIIVHTELVAKSPQLGTCIWRQKQPWIICSELVHAIQASIHANSMCVPAAAGIISLDKVQHDRHKVAIFIGPAAQVRVC